MDFNPKSLASNASNMILGKGSKGGKKHSSDAVLSSRTTKRPAKKASQPLGGLADQGQDKWVTVGGTSQEVDRNKKIEEMLANSESPTQAEMQQEVMNKQLARYGKLQDQCDRVVKGLPMVQSNTLLATKTSSDTDSTFKYQATAGTDFLTNVMHRRDVRGQLHPDDQGLPAYKQEKYLGLISEEELIQTSYNMLISKANVHGILHARHEDDRKLVSEELAGWSKTHLDSYGEEGTAPEDGTARQVEIDDAHATVDQVEAELVSTIIDATERNAQLAAIGEQLTSAVDYAIKMDLENKVIQESRKTVGVQTTMTLDPNEAIIQNGAAKDASKAASPKKQVEIDDGDDVIPHQKKNFRLGSPDELFPLPPSDMEWLVSSDPAIDRLYELTVGDDKGPDNQEKQVDFYTRLLRQKNDRLVTLRGREVTNEYKLRKVIADLKHQLVVLQGDLNDSMYELENAAYGLGFTSFIPAADLAPPEGMVHGKPPTPRSRTLVEVVEKFKAEMTKTHTRDKELVKEMDAELKDIKEKYTDQCKDFMAVKAERDSMKADQADMQEKFKNVLQQLREKERALHHADMQATTWASSVADFEATEAHQKKRIADLDDRNKKFVERMARMVDRTELHARVQEITDEKAAEIKQLSLEIRKLKAAESEQMMSGEQVRIELRMLTKGREVHEVLDEWEELKENNQYLMKVFMRDLEKIADRVMGIRKLLFTDCSAQFRRNLFNHSKLTLHSILLALMDNRVIKQDLRHVRDLESVKAKLDEELSRTETIPKGELNLQAQLEEMKKQKKISDVREQFTQEYLSTVMEEMKIALDIDRHGSHAKAALPDIPDIIEEGPREQLAELGADMQVLAKRVINLQSFKSTSISTLSDTFEATAQLSLDPNTIHESALHKAYVMLQTIIDDFSERIVASAYKSLQKAPLDESQDGRLRELEQWTQRLKVAKAKEVLLRSSVRVLATTKVNKFRKTLTELSMGDQSGLFVTSSTLLIRKSLAKAQGEFHQDISAMYSDAVDQLEEKFQICQDMLQLRSDVQADAPVSIEVQTDDVEFKPPDKPTATREVQATSKMLDKEMLTDQRELVEKEVMTDEQRGVAVIPDKSFEEKETMTQVDASEVGVETDKIPVEDGGAMTEAAEVSETETMTDHVHILDVGNMTDAGMMTDNLEGATETKVPSDIRENSIQTDPVSFGSKTQNSSQDTCTQTDPVSFESGRRKSTQGASRLRVSANSNRKGSTASTGSSAKVGLPRSPSKVTKQSSQKETESSQETAESLEDSFSSSPISDSVHREPTSNPPQSPTSAFVVLQADETPKTPADSQSPLSVPDKGVFSLMVGVKEVEYDGDDFHAHDIDVEPGLPSRPMAKSTTEPTSPPLSVQPVVPDEPDIPRQTWGGTSAPSTSRSGPTNKAPYTPFILPTKDIRPSPEDLPDVLSVVRVQKEGSAGSQASKVMTISGLSDLQLFRNEQEGLFKSVTPTVPVPCASLQYPQDSPQQVELAKPTGDADKRLVLIEARNSELGQVIEMLETSLSNMQVQVGSLVTCTEGTIEALSAFAKSITMTELRMKLQEIIEQSKGHLNGIRTGKNVIDQATELKHCMEWIATTVEDVISEPGEGESQGQSKSSMYGGSLAIVGRKSSYMSMSARNQMSEIDFPISSRVETTETARSKVTKTVATQTQSTEEDQRRVTRERLAKFGNDSFDLKSNSRPNSGAKRSTSPSGSDFLMTLSNTRRIPAPGPAPSVPMEPTVATNSHKGVQVEMAQPPKPMDIHALTLTAMRDEVRGILSRLLSDGPAPPDPELHQSIVDALYEGRLKDVSRKLESQCEAQITLSHEEGILSAAPRPSTATTLTSGNITPEVHSVPSSRPVSRGDNAHPTRDSLRPLARDSKTQSRPQTGNTHEKDNIPLTPASAVVYPLGFGRDFRSTKNATPLPMRTINMSRDEYPSLTSIINDPLYILFTEELKKLSAQEQANKEQAATSPVKSKAHVEQEEPLAPPPVNPPMPSGAPAKLNQLARVPSAARTRGVPFRPSRPIGTGGYPSTNR